MSKLNLYNVEKKNVSMMSENNTRMTFGDAIAVAQVNFRAVKVYAANVKSGDMKELTLDLVYNRTCEAEFVKAYLNFWYYLEYKKVNAEKAKFLELTLEDGEEDDAKVVLERIENTIAALEKYANAYSGVPMTVRLLVYADRNMKDKDFPKDVTEAFNTHITPVLNKIAKSTNYGGDGDTLGDVPALIKELRDAMKNHFCSKLWVASEGVVENYVFNCNNELATKVYCTYMKGCERDRKSGQFTYVYSKDKQVIRQVINLCFMSLQKKVQKQVEEGDKPITAAKKTAAK